MRTKIGLLVAIVTLLAAAPLLSACYTTAGAGKDLEAAGRGVKNSADRNTTYRP